MHILNDFDMVEIEIMSSMKKISNRRLYKYYIVRLNYSLIDM